MAPCGAEMQIETCREQVAAGMQGMQGVSSAFSCRGEHSAAACKVVYDPAACMATLTHDR